MRKIIAGINMTLDGFCDHTSMIADDEVHQHYSNLMRDADAIMWGRITYQLMESYWPDFVKNPSGDKAEDEFAVMVDNIPKIVFSHTLKTVVWNNTTLKKEIIKEEILQLKHQAGKDIIVGSRSLIVAFLNLKLIDEFQICVHPIIAGKGLSLLENINDRIDLKLLTTKTFNSGAIMLYYEPRKK